MFEGFDFTNFWSATNYGMSPPFSDELLREVEEELGYKLPESYIWLMKQHNGGNLTDAAFPVKQRLAEGSNAAMIDCIYGISRDGHGCLCGKWGGQFTADWWEYPPIGVAFGNGVFGMHEVYFLDYRECGPQGEPKVVHVDQEFDFRITPLADTFEEFIMGLAPLDTFPDD